MLMLLLIRRRDSCCECEWMLMIGVDESIMCVELLERECGK